MTLVKVTFCDNSCDVLYLYLTWCRKSNEKFHEKVTIEIFAHLKKAHQKQILLPIIFRFQA